MPRLIRKDDLISLDCETTGTDSFHGACPFLVTICREDGEQLCWEWNVDPLTRRVFIPPDDLSEIQLLIEECDLLVGQNLKFDFKALTIAFRQVGKVLRWPWENVRDTLTAGHLLASNHRHDLTSMVGEWLGEDVQRQMQALEDRMEVVVNKCRSLVRRHRPAWRIAKKGLPDMPSVKSDSKKEKRGVQSEKPWKFDLWLPKAVVTDVQEPDGKWKLHGNQGTLTLVNAVEKDWATVTRDYANMDSAVTLPLWLVMEKEIAR